MMNASFQELYEKLEPTITRLDDEQLIDAINEAVAAKVNKFIIAALVAEATFRRIALTSN
jgi:hypothetical protein